jgi:translation initiation factor 1
VTRLRLRVKLMFMAKEPRLVFTTDPEEAKRLRQSGAMPEARDAAPAEQTIRVAVDRKKRKGKSATVASGFRLTPASLEKVARQLKQRCAAGGTAEGDVIEIQGEHVDSVCAVLQGLGYRVKRG